MDAQTLSVLTSVAYVGSVYIFPGGRSNRRNDLDVMIRRIAGVCIMTAFTVANYSIGSQNWAWTFSREVGFNVLKAVGMLHLVYLPSIIVYGFPKIILKDKKHKVMALRDLIIGPVTEEFVYRGVIISLYTSGGFTNRQTIVENMLHFGIAHIHHAIMNWLNEVVNLRTAIMQGLVQFVMTGLFGTYAAYWVLRSGTIWPAVVSHLICNFYGPPNITGPSSYVFLTAAGIASWAYCLKYI